MWRRTLESLNPNAFGVAWGTLPILHCFSHITHVLIFFVIEPSIFLLLFAEFALVLYSELNKLNPSFLNFFIAQFVYFWAITFLNPSYSLHWGGLQKCVAPTQILIFRHRLTHSPFLIFFCKDAFNPKHTSCFLLPSQPQSLACKFKLNPFPRIVFPIGLMYSAYPYSVPVPSGLAVRDIGAFVLKL